MRLFCLHNRKKRFLTWSLQIQELYIFLHEQWTCMAACFFKGQRYCCCDLELWIMLCCKGELWSPWRRSITFFYPQPKTVEGVWEGVCVFGNMTKGEKVEGVEGRWRRGCADLRPPRPSVGSCPHRKHHLSFHPKEFLHLIIPLHRKHHPSLHPKDFLHLIIPFCLSGNIWDCPSACHQWEAARTENTTQILPKSLLNFPQPSFHPK